MIQSHLAPKEFSHKHIGALSRQKDVSAHIEQLGCLTKPFSWVYNKCNHLRVSLLIRGSGTYDDIKGRTTHVTGPALLIFKSDELASFEPDSFQQEWLEYYFIYQQACFDHISKVLQADSPIITFCLTTHIKDLLQYIQKTQENLNILGSADRLDLITQGLLAECSLQLNQCNNSTLKTTLEIRNYLDHNFLTEIDFEEITDKHEISMVTLRRYWNTWIGASPNRYLHNLKMQYAIQLILETNTPLGTIAQKIGFKDPLYFSRRFHDFTGMSASEYRKQYKITAP